MPWHSLPSAFDGTPSAHRAGLRGRGPSRSAACKHVTSRAQDPTRPMATGPTA